MTFPYGVWGRSSSGKRHGGGTNRRIPGGGIRHSEHTSFCVDPDLTLSFGNYAPEVPALELLPSDRGRLAVVTDRFQIALPSLLGYGDWKGP